MPTISNLSLGPQPIASGPPVASGQPMAAAQAAGAPLRATASFGAAQPIYTLTPDYGGIGVANPAVTYPGYGISGFGGFSGLGGSSDPAPPPVTDPVYATATTKSVDLVRIDAIDQTFLNAKRDLKVLREGLLGPPSPADGETSDAETALIERITTYVESLDPALWQEYLPDFAVAVQDEDGVEVRFMLPDLDEVIDPGNEVTTELTVGEQTEPQPFIQSAHSALFDAGKVMVKDIRVSDRLRWGLSMIRRARQRELLRLRERLDALEGRLPTERARLTTLERARIEALGDAAVAQRLLAEDWAEVEQAHAERRRVLEDNLGLYYVRVRETPISIAPPDPLSLRHLGTDDLVPGCAVGALDLPDELADFMQDVLEVPLADWTAFTGLHHLLPGRGRLDALIAQRRDRLSLRRQRPAVSATTVFGLRAATLKAQRRGLLTDLLARPFSATGSLLAVQQAGSRILSLEDLLSGPPHRLRDRARTLQQRLDTAAGCLLERLRALAPSLRLDWAAEAEADRLDVEHVERWPGLDRAEAADFDGVRTLSELIDWWFRQLASDAGAGSRGALRAYVRACLLFAAQDDPDQVLRGGVKTAPALFKPGRGLRLSLAREALPGTSLQLLDAAQRVVGTVRVDDNDDDGTLATVLSVIDADAVPDGSYTVSGVVGSLPLKID